MGKQVILSTKQPINVAIAGNVLSFDKVIVQLNDRKEVVSFSTEKQVKGDYVEYFAYDMPISIAKLLKNYLTVMTSPSAQESGVLKQSICLNEGLDNEIKVSSVNIYERQSLDEFSFVGRDYYIDLPSLYIDYIECSVPTSPTKCSMRITLEYSELMEFIKTFTYLGVY